MKKIMMTLMMVLASFSTQAQQGDGVGGVLSKNVTIELEEGASVVVLDLKSNFGVSCPGRLDLKTSFIRDGKVTVKSNNDINEAILTLAGRVSNSCGTEIMDDFKKGPIAVCLSFGSESGTVMIDIRQYNKSSLTIEFPADLNKTAITQL